jgi:SPP1 family predicted phage head-tail adaptor
MRAIDIGSFDRRITIRKKADTIDSSTHERPHEYTVNVKTVWAARRWMSSGEQHEARQQVGVDVVKYEIRWPSFVIDKDMAVYDHLEQQLYTITGIDKTDRKVKYVLTCQARDNE